MKASDIVLIIVLVFAFDSFCKLNAESNAGDAENDNVILHQWKEMNRNAEKMIGSVIKQIMPHVMESTSKINISSTCMQQSLTLLSGVRRLQVWALSFVDSSSKIIDGMLSGTVNSFGNYEQCLNSEVPSKDPAKPRFRGQYCQVAITPPLPAKSKRYKYDEEIEELENFKGTEVMNFLAKKAAIYYTFPYKVGLCLPSGCNLDEIDQVVKTMANKLFLSADVTVKYCEIKEPAHYSLVHMIAVLVCSALFGITILSTAYEIYLKNKEKKCYGKRDKVILTFSLISNFKALVSTKSSYERLESMHGILVFGIMMVALINTYLYPLFMMHTYHSLMSVYEMLRYPMGQIIMNNHVVVDTFLVVSGAWITYMALKLCHMQLEKFDFKLFILYKLWRIIPLYYFIILMSTLTSVMGSGPNFKEALKFSVENCNNYWWRNLLFINNFFDFDDMCLTHSWYISCDFQLYFSTLLVLLPLLKSQTMGLIITVVIVIASVVYTGLMTYLYDLIPGLDISYMDKDFRSESYLKVIANPLTHAGPYFLGVFVGYAVAVKKDIKIPKKYQILGWFIAVLCGAYTMLWTIVWRYYTPGLLETSIFAALQRTIWGAGVAWMLFCCCTGHGGFINLILSWKPWFPLSRLVLLVYLIQPVIEIVHIGSYKSPHEFSHFELVITSFGFLLLSGLLALIGSFLVESPVLAFEGVFFPTVKEALNIVPEKEHCNGKNVKKSVKFATNGDMEMNDFSIKKYDCMDNKAYEYSS
ncbi:O-acyltransferase like protein [Parasteatoda tepidariorum]|uniref:O-acyltransferase like protein n=1 Tax=Parasteatoda tepidariorum TaxID=114398 RepID=UPI001C719465|nr:nose resistant to fluoxetine protein 6 [Parasteatoda tepidariorum]